MLQKKKINSSLEGILVCEGLYIIFYLFTMHYNWTFSKKAYEFKFNPWKGQLSSLENFDSTFVIGSNLHYMERAFKKKPCEEKLTTN